MQIISMSHGFLMEVNQGVCGQRLRVKAVVESCMNRLGGMA
jgi:hypothetical protein